MKVTGVIAEYNPFHNGHRWQLQELRRAGSTHIVAVMGGNFLQRGDAALAPKQLRAELALRGGVDLVIELPLPYACAPAQRFAFGGVALLDAMGCVDELCFGSECGDMPLLRQAAQAVEDGRVRRALNRLLGDGFSFAKARQLAVEEVFSPSLAGLLGQPNNILGMEYLRQLELLSSPILPVTLPRQGADHDSGHAVGAMASASLIRRLLLEGGRDRAAPYLPLSSLPPLDRAWEAGTAPAELHRLERAVLARLRGMGREELARLPDLSEGLEHRLWEAVRQARSLDELLSLLKTKRYPLARLRRLVLCAFLGVPGHFCRTPPPYLRVLGFNRRGRELLGRLKETARLPLSHSLARLEELGGIAGAFAALEGASTDLYTLALPLPLACGADYTTPVIVLEE